MNLLPIYNMLKKWPLGKRLFTWLVCQYAPYFGSMDPMVLEMSASKCVVRLPKRRAVHNHLRTVHAIAMCNACELAMGMVMEAGLPAPLRWIPKGMQVQYLKKAETDLLAVCEYDLSKAQPGDHFLPVKVYDKNQVEVMNAVITIYVSEKKKS